MVGKSILRFLLYKNLSLCKSTENSNSDLDYTNILLLPVLRTRLWKVEEEIQRCVIKKTNNSSQNFFNLKVKSDFPEGNG